MIYFIMAQRTEGGEWDHFGPEEDIEVVDAKIVELEEARGVKGGSLFYSRVEIARVLTDEESTEWLRDPPSKPRSVKCPDHWPLRYEDYDSPPCNTIEGPCSCGAWHTMDEDWVQEMIGKHGLPEE